MMRMPVMEESRQIHHRAMPVAVESIVESTFPDSPRIRAALQQAFEGSPYRELQNIEVEIFSQRLRLRGSVPCFYLKQLAQELALNHAPEYLVSNEIRVLSNC
ncbi:MAG: BON domain-containing protein [Planctomycetales bacterium]